MEAVQEAPYPEKSSWLDRPLLGAVTLNWETVLFAVLFILAVFSRFYDLELRVMSHDETSHVYFSWLLEQGRGYKHDPVTHGPLQFHLVALSYFLFGDNDFSARIPAALFSIATVAFLWNYRRYLGRTGALVAAFLFLISPYMLYYGRYVRNEAFVAFFGVVTIWAMLRYLDTGAPRYLFWLTAATVFHFTSKETSFIYTAQALIFLALLFVFQVGRAAWPRPQYRNQFLAALIVAVLLLGGVGFILFSGDIGPSSATETAEPSVPGQATPFAASASVPALVLGGLAVLALLAAIFFLVRGYSVTQLRSERSLDMLILLGTLILPMLSPFPVKLLGWNPLDYSSQGMLRTSLFLIPLAGVAAIIGLWWNARLWLANAALFYGVFVVFYTTIFTNGAGFFTGLVGSLGYWLDQQGVQRGNQPWYYYVFLQVPVYEYLIALGSLLALGLAVLGKGIAGQRSETGPSETAATSGDVALPDETLEEATLPEKLDPPAANSDQRLSFDSGRPELKHAVNLQQLTVTLLGFWTITSILAYTYAGEKMPWLTVHIALPMILLAGWAFGYFISTTDWAVLRARRGWLVAVLLLVFLTSLAAAAASLLGTHPPFQGKELEQLQATSTFLTSLLVLIASGAGLVYLMRSWPIAQIGRLFVLAVFSLLALLTARTAMQASYINYNNATEFLVYAHSGPGPKQALAQIEEISRRTTDGLALVVAYDDNTTYPFWWYLRNYPNARYFGANPTRDLREAPTILVGAENYSKIEPIVGQAYHRFDYIRMWWPTQDYYDLNWERVRNVIVDPRWRSAVFQIWLNRDYDEYSQLVERDMSLPSWQPSSEMRLYVRKDIAAQVWNYGVGPTAEELVTDPYEGKEANLEAGLILGAPGAGPGQFNRPRDVAVAPDGSLFVADTDNHRVQHISRDGTPLHTWGSLAKLGEGPAPGGTFWEPWGIAVSPDGFVYVADTWNHRIQKFNLEGEFVSMWGFFGQAETPAAFWGPRDVMVAPDGRVFVADTGNKRVVVFDADGNFISQFGSEGFEPSQFNEPVGLAIDGEGRLYVADTWNQRIQTFAPDGAGGFTPIGAWDVFAWYGQSLDNKPYLAADDQGHIFASDPEGYRVLEFDSQGELVRYWGDYSLGADGFGLAGAPAVDPAGGIWVTDTGNNRVLHFELPGG
jgi:uncharacterized protein (TIGR03663 family)